MFKSVGTAIEDLALASNTLDFPGELTKAAIDDIIIRGAIRIWRKLIQAMNADKTRRIARRVNDVAQTLGKPNPRARAFASLLRKLPHKPHNAVAE